MPLPLADFDKRPVVFVDVLTPMLTDLYRAFDVQFVLTSNVIAGQARNKVELHLVEASLISVARNLHENWASPWDCDSTLNEEVEAWHASNFDSTPTSYLIVTTKERGERLDHILAAYAVIVDGQSTRSNYFEACRILHSQTSFVPFDSNWY